MLFLFMASPFRIRLCCELPTFCKAWHYVINYQFLKFQHFFSRHVKFFLNILCRQF